ncbi:LamG-like jellyroll fold domain-containing protein [Winogradskyella sp.]|uniref:LamG-like jellyroll fold domain-containing protein n=1 Tax=Winogradskyella sp. TaxID=1883156 RepID=UPI003F6BF654
MNTFTLTLKGCTLLLCSLLFSLKTNAQTCGTTITSYPYAENFESGIGSWTQDTGDDLNWLRDSGGTPSSNTGPSSGNGDTWYMFVEASGNGTGYPNKVANFESPCFDLTSVSNAFFNYSYHMYGSSMGTLNIDVSTDNGATYPTTLRTYTGDLGNQWNTDVIDLSAYIGSTIKLRFNATTGSDWASDFAIDNISLTDTLSYCAIAANNDYFEYIGNVTLGTINNNSGQGTTSTGYSDFTAISTNLTQGSVNPISITPIWTGTLYNEAFAVYIDFNQDFDFNDPGELVFTAGPNTVSPQLGTVTVPGGAATGSTRMRVIMDDVNPVSGPCVNPNFGEVEDYTVNIIAASPFAEIDVTGNGISITSGDITPSITDDTDFGSTDVGVGVANNFTIHNYGGSFNLNLTGPFPYIQIGGAHAADFSVSLNPGSSINPGNSTVFQITFNPSAAGIRSATIRILNDASDENPYIFDIQGYGIPPLTEGPGGVTTDLALWLKGTDGLTYTDGQSVSIWRDQGRGADATVNTAGQEPTYRDNVSQNVNFNPVVEFDNSYGTFTLDGDFSFDDTSTQFLEGTSGLYTQDMFVVIIPDETPINNSFGFMDVFCGDENVGTNETDATGIGLGDYTGRFTDEIITYCVGTTSGGLGYGVAEIGTGSSYNNVGIINTRNNSGATQQELYYNANNIETTQNDLPDFSNVNDSPFWIGRSEGWEASLNGRVAEIITFSARKDDTNLTQERNRVMSYLGIKYGITLGINGTSQDYVDSDGTVIWDQSVNSGYNYDIAGIGRDDDSDLNQKQSRSVNNASDVDGRTQGIITMGLSDIYDTNNINKVTNPTTFNDKEFLIWGNNGINLNAASTTVTINMSSGISPALTTEVTFTAMQRIWKVVENGGDIPEIKVRIPQAAVRNITPPGSYLMFISNTGIFDPTADYRVMTSDGTGNLEAEYDFDGTKYITFGYAPEVIVERSVYFDGAVDYIDMEDNLNLNPGRFTVSAWIKRDAADSGTKSILSKRDAAFTRGYDLTILNDNRVEMDWINGSTQSIISNTRIPDDEWHHVAVTYDGTTAYLYIDGVEDRNRPLSPPVATDESFYIAAAGKNTPVQHFRGNIDEVRVWNTMLSPDQLRFVMNQEIEANGSQAMGIELPTSITKNDINAVAWSDLAGYYPMTTYTYTITSDASGNGHQGALRNLNTVDRQTAPLPYESAQNGDWDTNATWANGNVQYIPGSTSIVDNNVTIDWNIVRTSHDVTLDNSSLPAVNQDNRKILGLYVDANELTVNGDNATNAGNGITVSHYLSLTGKIDLEGESQLIQEEDSDLDVAVNGELERDQQGTADTYTYNYWSAPVGDTDTGTNDYRYTVQDIFYDGTNPVNFLTSGYDGATTNPVGIADYWIWKYANLPSDDYSAWQHVRRTGTIMAGEGFTMKGPGTGTILTDQNYVYKGKPNNGDINLTINAGNDYLVGNPYASAIDADEFIRDNGPELDYDGPLPDATPTISGTLYFWEHWGGGSHILSEYQGSYATYNFSGAVASASMGTNDPDVGTGGTPTKLPSRYIPVGQGFFVVGENAGTINFNNGQRVFQKEGGATSVFMRNSEVASSQSSADINTTDERMKFRIGFNSVNTIHRQLLLTIDENTSSDVDWAYDAKLNEEQMDDMFWMINDDAYVIQASNEAEVSTAYPLGVITDADGINTITIDALENVPSDIDIYLHDIDLDLYHNLRASDYEIFLNAGEYLERLEITFSPNGDALSTDDETINGIDILYSNDIEKIVLINPNQIDVKSIEMFNILGQSVHTIENISDSGYSEYDVKNLSTGTYIIKLFTVSGSVTTKKVLVN